MLSIYHGYHYSLKKGFFYYFANCYTFYVKSYIFEDLALIKTCNKPC